MPISVEGENVMGGFGGCAVISNTSFLFLLESLTGREARRMVKLSPAGFLPFKTLYQPSGSPSPRLSAESMTSGSSCCREPSSRFAFKDFL